MNQDQVLSGLRWALTVAGTFALARGVTPADWGVVTNFVINTVTGAMAVAPVVWGWYAHTKEAKIKAASALPEVKAITVTDPSLATAAKQADPSTIVTASARAA